MPPPAAAAWDRLRALLAPRKPVEKTMFGGRVLMVDAKMVVCLSRDWLMFRVGKDREPAALQRPGSRVFAMTGRAMHGFIQVEFAAVRTDAPLRLWLDDALAYVDSIPAKKPNPKKPNPPKPKPLRSRSAHAQSARKSARDSQRNPKGARP